MESIKKLNTKPRRVQVYAQLKEKLLRGDWKTGTKIPSEHALCEMFGVSRVTVRSAIQQLEILGLVKRGMASESILEEHIECVIQDVKDRL
jgi:GntR family transcriptional repressor for pyruvate dehydrogenase complex